MQSLRSVSAKLILTTFAAVAVLMPTGAHAQAGSTTLTIEPHCTETDRSLCPTFSVLDAENLTTELLKSGDLIDIDVVLRSTEPERILDIHSWLSYDPEILEARSVSLRDAITSPTPGEETIEAANEIVKIGGGVSGLAESPVAIARVTFRILKAGTDTTIGFSRYLPTGGGNTAVNGINAGGSGDDYEGSLPPPPCIDPLIGCDESAMVPLLSGKPASLVVKLNDGTSPSPSSSAATTSGTSSSSNIDLLTRLQEGISSSQAVRPLDSETEGNTRFDVAPSAFTLLQVQAVQVTTRDNTAYLGWQALNSTEVTGYNIYYGAVSGRYLQRRSIPPTYGSTVIRDLEPGVTYYFAVRGFNALNEESQFSKEVSVTIGQPETATSPLVGSGLPTVPGENVVTNNGGSVVTGETGASSTLGFLFVLSALIGTFFAFRRQLSLSGSL